MKQVIKGLFKMFLVYRKASKYDKMFNYHLSNGSAEMALPYFHALERCEKLINKIHNETFNK